MQNLICRVARLEDLEAFVNLSKACFSYEVGILGAAPPGYDSVEYYTEAITTHKTFCVVVDGSVIIGGAVVKKQHPGLYLSRFFISPSYQGRGIGKFFLSQIENYFDFSSIWQLHVAKLLPQVVSFYIDLGYDFYSEETIGSIDFHIMRKKVDPIPSLFIQFTGTQSTGKTTLADAIQKNFSLLGIKFLRISEISRSLQQSGVIKQIDTDASLVTQMVLNAELLLKYLEAITLNPVKTLILADRSPICCLGYARNLLTGFQDTVFRDYVINFTQRFVDWSRRYQLNLRTVYFPPVIPFHSDGIRKFDSREQIDNEIQNILNEFSILPISLNDTSFTSRFDYLNTFIISYFTRNII